MTFIVVAEDVSIDRMLLIDRLILGQIHVAVSCLPVPRDSAI